MSTPTDTPAEGLLPVSTTASWPELNDRVQRSGLLASSPGYYGFKITSNALLYVATIAVLLLAGDSWWQLLTAVLAAFSFIQTAYIAHDAGHRQVARGKRGTEIAGLVHMNLLLGVTFGWWVAHHNKHHAGPNNLDRDPDTSRRIVAFAASELPVKAVSPFRRFVIRNQRLMFFVLLGQEAVRMRKAGFVAARAGLLKRPVLELSLVVFHLVAYLTLVFTVLSPLTAACFVLVHQVLFGVFLGGVFAPNHKGMPVYRDDQELDWLHKQVLTSRNIRSGRLADYLFGGVNYQIEHHLFPTMTRANLRRARPVVREYCDQHSVEYHEVSALDSYLEVASHLGDVAGEARTWMRGRRSPR
jgi:fatty acid desaturase